PTRPVASGPRARSDHSTTSWTNAHPYRLRSHMVLRRRIEFTLPMCPEWTSEGWRRERDSNPRNGSPFCGFQDRRLQPLGHLSVLGIPKRFESIASFAVTANALNYEVRTEVASPYLPRCRGAIPAFARCLTLADQASVRG